MEITISELNLSDPTEVQQWYDAYYVAMTHQDPMATPLRLPEIVAIARGADVVNWERRYVARLADRVVGGGSLGLPLKDNLETAELDVFIHPDWWRQGIGSAVLSRLSEIATRRGRTILQAVAAWPISAGDGKTWPARLFLEGHGFRYGLSDVQRRLPLPVAPSKLAGLLDQARRRADDYQVISWRGPVPERWIGPLGALSGDLMVDAPMGGMTFEAEQIDAESLRYLDQILAEMGREKLTTIAVSQAGELVAYTDLVISIHEPELCFQWGTMVRRDHRGHRLGMLVKAENVRQLAGVRPELTAVVTFNAGENEHMIAVNEELGFAVAGLGAEFEKRTSG